MAKPTKPSAPTEPPRFNSNLPPLVDPAFEEYDPRVPAFMDQMKAPSKRRQPEYRFKKGGKVIRSRIG